MKDTVNADYSLAAEASQEATDPVEATVGAKQGLVQGCIPA